MLHLLASRGQIGHEVIFGGVLLFFSTGLYPEIPEVSQLDFSALKEEVVHLFMSLILNSLAQFCSPEYSPLFVCWDIGWAITLLLSPFWGVS